jgi:hypothetical protein
MHNTKRLRFIVNVRNLGNVGCDANARVRLRLALSCRLAPWLDAEGSETVPALQQSEEAKWLPSICKSLPLGSSFLRKKDLERFVSQILRLLFDYYVFKVSFFRKNTHLRSQGIFFLLGKTCWGGACLAERTHRWHPLLQPFTSTDGRGPLLSDKLLAESSCRRSRGRCSC